MDEDYLFCSHEYLPNGCHSYESPPESFKHTMGKWLGKLLCILLPFLREENVVKLFIHNDETKYVFFNLTFRQKCSFAWVVRGLSVEQKPPRPVNKKRIDIWGEIITKHRALVRWLKQLSFDLILSEKSKFCTRANDRKNRWSGQPHDMGSVSAPCWAHA